MRWLDWLEKFWFRYFSSSTLDSKDYWVRYIVYGIMMIPFSLGFLFTILELSDLVGICSYILAGMLVPFAIVWIIVWFYHNWKIKKFNKYWE